MAVIKPFRGVRYNPARVENLDVVVSQPYDRISPELAAEYAGLCPYNISGIILGHHEDDSLPAHSPADEDPVYLRARENYTAWLDDGILIRDDQPALYAYEQTFIVDDQEYVRLGMISAVELAEFDEGIILPHERTHSGPKEDRLHLLETLQVNTEQIFMLYPDPENRVNALLQQAIGDRAPDMDVVEHFENQVRQRVWIITDPEVINAIMAYMASLRGLIIADGHHRYETALNYRNAQHAAHDDIPANAALNYVGAALVSMDDPGLVVLPTHREIHSLASGSPTAVLMSALEHFAVTATPDLATTLEVVDGDPTGQTFGFYGGAKTGFHVLTLHDDTPLADLINENRSADWKSLAVTILHRLLLEQVAEVPAAGIDDKSLVRYHRDPALPVANIDAGKGDFVFFVSATAISQIKAVAAHGEKMPQKSTDFYPKIISGLTMLPVGPEEVLSGPIALSHGTAVPSGD